MRFKTDFPSFFIGVSLIFTKNEKLQDIMVVVIREGCCRVFNG